MSCEISLGRLEGCKDQIGGLNAIYFVNFGDTGAWTITDENITAIAATTPSAYKYDLRGNSTFEQSLTSSRENGTTVAEQTSFFVMGEDFGAEMNASTSTGAGMADKSGYELTFVASEKGLSKFYTGDVATDFSVVLGS